MKAVERIVLVLLALYFLIVLVGKFAKDPDSAEANAERYCQMVHDGDWPDYQGNYDKFCTDGKWNGK